MIPDFARDKITEEVPLRSPIAEIADLVASVRSKGESTVGLGVPGGSQLVALINHELASEDRRRFGAGLGPTQVVERIYWQASITPIARILDVVRTTLVELVAEMRAGMPPSESVPSHEIAERAFDIAVHGNKNRVVQNVYVDDQGQVAMTGTGATGAGGQPESGSRRLMWWIVGIATVVGAVGSSFALLR